uniref:Uncharacterized protein n=1 Tax=Romanomermis culicivorax TaxID=13658 RepID=A0A915IMP0_ROMCU
MWSPKKRRKFKNRAKFAFLDAPRVVNAQDVLFERFFLPLRSPALRRICPRSNPDNFDHDSKANFACWTARSTSFSPEALQLTNNSPGLHTQNFLGALSRVKSMICRKIVGPDNADKTFLYFVQKL